MQILEIANQHIRVEHPTQKGITFLNDLMFCQNARTADGAYRNQVVFGDGQTDRSPCGTGTAARMAKLHAEGKLGLNQEFIHESVIGTWLTGWLVREEQLGGVSAVIPRISGETYITGFHNFVVDQNDPLRKSFLL